MGSHNKIKNRYLINTQEHIYVFYGITNSIYAERCQERRIRMKINVPCTPETRYDLTTAAFICNLISLRCYFHDASCPSTSTHSRYQRNIFNSNKLIPFISNQCNDSKAYIRRTIVKIPRM